MQVHRLCYCSENFSIETESAADSDAMLHDSMAVESE